MAEQHKEHSNTLPVAPSLEPTLDSIYLPRESSPFGKRSIKISVYAILLGIAAGFIAQILTRLIGLITNISFYGRFSFDFSSPAGNSLGLYVIIVPVIGALIIGVMAKYGSKGIRGHGIPEAMEQIILNESRIPPRLTFLKPVSAAISIGTGGPFGAEGPIIATGGALGSLIGQLIKTTADERKTLLAAGAAAGMAATFGSPVSAVLLSVELLLFEFRPQSLIPVTLASAAATALRIFFEGSEPIFSLQDLEQPGSFALLTYLLMGGLYGIASVYVTRSVYKIEDAFEKLPLHWMWWPAIGGLAVGIIGYFVPQTLGVGYDNIANILTGSLTGNALIILFVFKFLSWSLALGSGTSGGTLAPLFTIGGAMGSLLGSVVIIFFPGIGIDIRIAALVGMAALFAGSARALLASIIFAFEITLQPVAFLPLLAGCSASYLVSSLMMKHTIMTEKIARRGIRIPFEYQADFFEQVLVKDCASYDVASIRAEDTIEQVRKWFSSGSKGSQHHGYPVVKDDNTFIGIITRREILNPALSLDKKIYTIISGPAAVVYPENTLKEAVDLMADLALNWLPVVERNNPTKIKAILSRTDILRERKKNLEKKRQYIQSLKIPALKYQNTFKRK